MVATNPFRGLEIGAQLATHRADRNLRLGLTIAESRRAEIINRFERAKAEKEAKKQAKKNKPGFGGTIGTGVGAIAGGLLAAPTGGLSVLAGAALGASAGGSLGSALDPGSANPGPAVGSAFAGFDKPQGSVTDFDSFIDQILRSRGQQIQPPSGIPFNNDFSFSLR